MGTMTFEGRYVKRHYQDRETGLIKIIFHQGPPILVPYQEWKAKQRMVGHAAGVRRCEVIRAAVAC